MTDPHKQHETGQTDCPLASIKIQGFMLMDRIDSTFSPLLHLQIYASFPTWMFLSLSVSQQQFFRAVLKLLDIEFSLKAKFQ